MSQPTAQRTSASQAPTRVDLHALDIDQPGPEHALLATLAGTWDVAYAHWFQDGAEPTLGRGAAIVTAVFEGRYLREEFSAQFAGKPILGVGTTGFDRVSRRFTNVWYDNRGTGMLCTTGLATPDGREITFTGEILNPATGEPIGVSHVLRRESDDFFTLSMYNDRDGRLNKSMALEYRRRR
jgi:hypothetical protein